MAPLVFSGVFDRHPALKVVTHHGGSMVPFDDGRIGPGMAVLGSRTSDEDHTGILPGLERPHLDYFRLFYADTAMFGGGSGLLGALAFFGPDRPGLASGAPLRPVPGTAAAVGRLAGSYEERGSGERGAGNEGRCWGAPD